MSKTNVLATVRGAERGLRPPLPPRVVRVACVEGGRWALGLGMCCEAGIESVMDAVTILAAATAAGEVARAKRARRLVAALPRDEGVRMLRTLRYERALVVSWADVGMGWELSGYTTTAYSVELCGSGGGVAGC